MSDTKLKLKDPGTIHLMALDSTSLFLPFGRPISEYLTGAAGAQNGSRAFLNRGAIDFPASPRWDESIASLLQTTGFGEIEREGLAEVEPAIVEAPPPPMAGFLSLEAPRFASPEASPAKTLPAGAHEEPPVTLPRVLALPLRQRMTLGAPPQKAKPAPSPAPKPVAATPAVKPAPVAATPSVAPPKQTPPAPAAAAPPKQAPAAPVKPASPPAAKTTPPPPVQAKPAAPIPPAPKPGPAATPASRVTVLQPPTPATPKPAKPSVPAPPAARTPEPTPTRTTQRPVVSPAARANETSAPPRESAPIAKPVQAPPPAAKATTPVVTSSRPLAPPFPSEHASSSTNVVEQAPAHEVIARETPKPKEPAPTPAPRNKGPLSITDTAPTPVETAPSSFERSLGASDSVGLFERIPMAVKIGAVLSMVAAGLYFGIGSKSSERPATSKPVAVGEQGWSTEWASDVVGSRRARQLTMYRPSAGLTDYQFQFAGQIESKAIGWIFRASDTKNYYAMKIENLRPGTMGITHFAVVDGRESSYSQKPLALDARPGTVYNVKLDVTGPRFTVSVAGEPVDFWTDNRLKSGSVGLMNERDERGVASAVQFSFAQVGK